MPPADFVDPQVSWKAKAVYWLSNQGPATILLLIILYGTHVNVPLILKQITSGYEQNAERLNEAAKQYEIANDKVLEALLKDRTLLMEMLRDKQSASHLTPDGQTTIIKETT